VSRHSLKPSSNASSLASLGLPARMSISASTEKQGKAPQCTAREQHRPSALHYIIGQERQSVDFAGNRGR
jgi:hypothetical protein